LYKAGSVDDGGDAHLAATHESLGRRNEFWFWMKLFSVVLIGAWDLPLGLSAAYFD